MTLAWLDGAALRGRNHAAALGRLLTENTAVPLAGVYDGMSALIARQTGFRALYLSGAGLSASMALPDLGLLTMEDVCRRAKEIVRAADLPLIVDADTGFGEALNVMRAVRELEEVGAACIQIEDQQFPKKCGHLNDKRLVAVEDMCRKLTAARKAADQLLICARTDAAAVSLDEAISRANRYVQAGAHIVFVEALTTPAAIRQVREQVGAPLLANMTEFGRTPAIPLSQWTEYGYQLVIFPVSAFRVVSRSLQRFYASLLANGHVGEFLPDMMTRAELYETISYYDYEALDASIARTVLDP